MTDHRYPSAVSRNLVRSLRVRANHLALTEVKPVEPLPAEREMVRAARFEIGREMWALADELEAGGTEETDDDA